MLRSLALALEHGLGEPELARGARGGGRRRARLDADAGRRRHARRRPSSATPCWRRSSSPARRSRDERRPSATRARPAATAPPRRPLLAPDGCDDRAVRRASSPSSRRRSRPRSRSACCRSRTRSTARSPRRTTCSTRRRSRSSREVTLPIVHCLLAKSADPGLRGAGRCARTRPRSTSAASSSHTLGVRCIPTATTADAAREVAESDDPTEAAIASAEAAARFGLARDRAPTSATTRRVHALRRDRAVHARRPRRRAGAPRSRSSPTTSRARSTTRSGRSTATA